MDSYGIKSAIAAPLVVKGETMAALSYNYTSATHSFSDVEEEFVSRLASSLSTSARARATRSNSIAR